MQLGKFSSDRDSALHFLCISEWSNESFGDIEAPTGYVWRISNTQDDIFGSFGRGNTEIDSVLQEWEVENIEVEQYEELRRSLIGHFLVIEDSNGLVHVIEWESEAQLVQAYNALEKEYGEWLGEGE